MRYFYSFEYRISAHTVTSTKKTTHTHTYRNNIVFTRETVWELFVSLARLSLFSSSLVCFKSTLLVGLITMTPSWHNTIDSQQRVYTPSPICQLHLLLDQRFSFFSRYEYHYHVITTFVANLANVSLKMRM